MLQPIPYENRHAADRPHAARSFPLTDEILELVEKAFALLVIVVGSVRLEFLEQFLLLFGQVLGDLDGHPDKLAALAPAA